MANIHITSALPPSNAAICGHWTRETAQKTAIRAVNPCSPEAEVTGSNPVGCAISKVHGPRITGQVTESKQHLFRGRSLVDHGVGKVSGILL